MIKRISAFILAISFIAASYGCSSENNSSDITSTGRYVEEVLSVPERPVTAGELFRQNSKTAFIDMRELKLYTEDEETKTFTVTSLPSLDELGTDYSVSSISGGPDGSYILSYYLYDNEDDNSTNFPVSQYAYLSPDGKLQKLDIGLKHEFQTFDIDDNGNIFACSFSGDIYQINVKEQSADLIFSIDKNLTAMDTVSDYLIAADSSAMYFYDIKNKKLVETPEAMTTFYKEQGLNTKNITETGPVFDFCQGADNSIYIISKKGLYRYVIDGNQVEQLLDGMSYHIGNPAYTVRSVEMLSDNSFIVTYNQGSVMRYSFDASASNNISSALKIYSLKENDTLNQIISEFKINHPEISVKLETGMNDGDSITYEDAIKNLNTEILSDQAPDVIMLDGINTENYINKNMLLDLSEYEDKIDPDNSLVDSIAKHYTDDHLYTMTCKFKLPVLVAKKDNLTKINNFSSLADMVENQHKTMDINSVTELFTEDEILNMALDFNGNEILNNNSLDTQKLGSMLESCLKIYKNDRAAFTDSQISDYIYSKKSASDDQNWAYGTPGRSLYVTNNTERVTCGTIDGFIYGINMITSLNDLKPEIGYRFGLSENSSIYIPVCSLGVCSSGKNKDGAVKFLSFAFGQEIQNVELNDGFPVNRSSLQYFYDKGKTESPMAFGLCDMFSSDQIYIGTKWMDDSEIELFKKTVDKLDTPVEIDTMTRDVIIDIGTQCLDGTITSEQAADQINEKLSLKMNE